MYGGSPLRLLRSSSKKWRPPAFATLRRVSSLIKCPVKYSKFALQDELPKIGKSQQYSLFLGLFRDLATTAAGLAALCILERSQRNGPGPKQASSGSDRPNHAARRVTTRSPRIDSPSKNREEKGKLKHLKSQLHGRQQIGVEGIRRLLSKASDLTFEEIFTSSSAGSMGLGEHANRSRNFCQNTSSYESHSQPLPLKMRCLAIDHDRNSTPVYGRSTVGRIFHCDANGQRGILHLKGVEVCCAYHLSLHMKWVESAFDMCMVSHSTCTALSDGMAWSSGQASNECLQNDTHSCLRDGKFPRKAANASRIGSIDPSSSPASGKDSSPQPQGSASSGT